MSASYSMVESPAAPEGYRRLTPLDWRLGVTVTLGGLVVSFFALGFFNPYWRTADQDILLVYDAFLQNDGLPREVVFHPAHLIVSLIGGALRLLHDLGFLTTYSLTTLAPASDLAAFEHGWTAAVRVARVVSLLLALAYIAVFCVLLRRLTGDWRAALLGAFALAYSGGISVAVRAAKPELMSGAFAALALLILLIAARSPRLSARPLLIGAAAAIATLGMVNKVQAIFLVCALPLLLLPFGEHAGGGYWRGPRAFISAAGIAVIAALAAAAAWPLLMEGLFPNPAPAWIRSPFGLGEFQLLLAIWLGLGILAFAFVWRVSWVETAAVAAAVIGGVALGLLPLYIRHESLSTIIVLNPINALAQFVDPSKVDCRGAGCGLPIAALLDGVITALKAHSFVFKTSTRPTIFLEWAVIAGAVFAWRRGERKIVLQIVLLIGAAIGIDSLSATRALKIDYHHFSDPLIVIAGAVLLARVPDLQRHRLLYPIGALLLVAHGVMSQFYPVKEAFLRRGGADTKCYFLNDLTRIERFPFCAK